MDKIKAHGVPQQRENICYVCFDTYPCVKLSLLSIIMVTHLHSEQQQQQQHLLPDEEQHPQPL